MIRDLEQVLDPARVRGGAEHQAADAQVDLGAFLWLDQGIRGLLHAIVQEPVLRVGRSYGLVAGHHVGVAIVPVERQHEAFLQRRPQLGHHRARTYGRPAKASERRSGARRQAANRTSSWAAAGRLRNRSSRKSTTLSVASAVATRPRSHWNRPFSSSK